MPPLPSTAPSLRSRYTPPTSLLTSGPCHPARAAFRSRLAPTPRRRIHCAPLRPHVSASSPLRNYISASFLLPRPQTACTSPRSLFAHHTMATSTPAGGTMTDPAAAGSISPSVPDDTAAAAATSGVTAQDLEMKLRETVQATEVSVEDISGRSYSPGWERVGITEPYENGPSETGRWR